ncbi:MAG TPA: hypothetical protein VNF51_02575 [Candidatus Paceibacterota bacterium]|nr:hypothetical protein [Candidatus Paceibacterota bacterium]
MRSLFVIIAFSLLIPGAALAQSLGGLGNNAPFTLSASPQYPTPYGTATLSFLSSSLDLSNAMLSVSSDGKNIYQGSVQPIVVTLGRTGSITHIAATISSGGTKYSQSLSIQPEDVVLVAEPIASAPPLYPGKPSVPPEGSVRVVAVANMEDASGALLNPAALSYAWTVDGTQIADASGIGKDVLMVASPLQYRARTVSVAVMSQDGSLVGGDSLSFSTANPTVLIYENDPLLGIRFDHALSGTYTITSVESTLYAAPFSFPMVSATPALQWFLDGSAAQTGNVITLRPTGSGAGTATLSLTASAGSYTTATANLSLSFGLTTSTNAFGL